MQIRLFTQRFLLLAVLIISGIGTGYAQSYPPRLWINGPSGVGGPKQFRYAGDPAATSPWSRDIDTQYLNIPIVKVYDTLASNSPLLNGTGSYPSLAGKFALVFRGGGIPFTQKAVYAQAAGAIGVIIVNHKNGGPVGMAYTAIPGFNSPTIPVLSIGREDGFAINNAIKAGQNVTISLSNWGFNKTNDIGFLNFSPTLPHAFCVPLSQISGQPQNLPRAYNFYNSAYVCNFGSANQTNVKLKQTLSFTPSGGTANTIYTDSAILPSLQQVDSIGEVASPRFTRLPFASTGMVNMNYSLTSNNTDENPADNSTDYQMYITDSVFSKGRWNTATNAPKVSVSWRYNGATPLIWGPLFYVNKGGYRAQRAQLAIQGDSDQLTTNTVAPALYVYLYKWNDSNRDGLVNGKELKIVAAAYKSNFTTSDSSGKPFMVDLTNAQNNKLIAKVQDSSWYFLAAQVEHDFSIGADYESNYMTRTLRSVHVDSSAGTRPEWWGPASSKAPLGQPTYSFGSVDTLQSAPFTATDVSNPDATLNFFSSVGLVPAMALHLSKDIPTGVATIGGNSPFTNVSLYPNPASDELRVNFALSKLSNVGISVINSIGQSILFKSLGTVKDGQVSYSTSSYANGTYYFVIGTDDGVEVRPFVVAH